MIRDQEAQKILEKSRHLDDVAQTIAERARLLKIEGSTEGPLEQTAVYHKVRGLLDVWYTYAEDLSHEHVSLNYTTDKLSTSRKLLHEMLDPKLVNLSHARQQFKAPRSMRDVEPNVALLPRLFNQDRWDDQDQGRTDDGLVPAPEPACDDVRPRCDDRPSVVRRRDFGSRLLGQRRADLRTTPGGQGQGRPGHGYGRAGDAAWYPTRCPTLDQERRRRMEVPEMVAHQGDEASAVIRTDALIKPG